jgi:pimeloyl-ACP methyl ester carboxylesterase
MWFRLVPELAAHHRVITFDNRGIGRNAGEDVTGLTIEGMAADAVAVVDASGEESVHVLGTSLGGIVAQELAIAYPERVRKLVLLSTHTADEHAVPADGAVREMLATRSALPREASLRASVPYAYAPSTSAALIDEDLALRGRWMPDAAAYDAQLAAAARFRGTWSRLPGIDNETLVLHGTADLIVPPENALRIAAQLPHARLDWIEGGGHNLFSERAEDVGREVVAFLSAG